MIRLNRFLRLKPIICCMCSLLFLGACTHRTADLTVISTKNIDLQNVQVDVKQGSRLRGEDCVYWPLGLIPTGYPNLETAVDDALQKGNGNIMVDQVTYRSGIWFILASRICIEVEGTVLNVAEKSS